MTESFTYTMIRSLHGIREFPIKDVMDFSYREIANQGGILYLHTLQGVYTYIVKSSPEAFITAYRAYFK